MTQRPLTAAQRGYGLEYQREKKRLDTLALRGEIQLICHFCNQPIDPKQTWHLDHSIDRKTLRGPAHAHCNTKDGGKRGAEKTNYQKHVTKRDW